MSLNCFTKDREKHRKKEEEKKKKRERNDANWNKRRKTERMTPNKFRSPPMDPASAEGLHRPCKKNMLERFPDSWRASMLANDASAEKDYRKYAEEMNRRRNCWREICPISTACDDYEITWFQKVLLKNRLDKGHECTCDEESVRNEWWQFARLLLLGNSPEYQSSDCLFFWLPKDILNIILRLLYRCCVQDRYDGPIVAVHTGTREERGEVPSFT